MRRPRRNHTAVFKAKVVLAAIKGDNTLSELAEQFDVHPNQITQWKTQLLERAMEIFTAAGEKVPQAGPSVKELHAKIGQLAMENGFLKVSKQQIHAERNIDLGEHGVFAVTKEALDLEVVLNPFEEKLDLPAFFIDLGDGLRREMKDVGEKDVVFVALEIALPDAPKRGYPDLLGQLCL